MWWLVCTYWKLTVEKIAKNASVFVHNICCCKEFRLIRQLSSNKSMFNFTILVLSNKNRKKLKLNMCLYNICFKLILLLFMSSNMYLSFCFFFVWDFNIILWLCQGYIHSKSFNICRQWQFIIRFSWVVFICISQYKPNYWPAKRNNKFSRKEK